MTHNITDVGYNKTPYGEKHAIGDEYTREGGERERLGGAREGRVIVFAYSIFNVRYVGPAIDISTLVIDYGRASFYYLQ